MAERNSNKFSILGVNISAIDMGDACLFVEDAISKKKNIYVASVVRCYLIGSIFLDLIMMKLQNLKYIFIISWCIVSITQTKFQDSANLVSGQDMYNEKFNCDHKKHFLNSDSAFKFFWDVKFEEGDWNGATTNAKIDSVIVK